MEQISEVTVKLYRYDPDVDKEPYYQTFRVPYEKQMRVMDALTYIYDNYETFGFKWYCGTKRCGACSVRVNGKPLLACWEPAQREMTVEPLKTFPVVRDLVVDFSGSEKLLTEFKPVLQRAGSYEGFPERITHDEMKQTYDLMFCVDCRTCVEACPVMSDAERNEFAGPYVLVQLAKVALDPRDGGTNRDDLILKTNIQACDSCGSCARACPAGVPVLIGAIDPLRDRLVKNGRYYIRGWSLIKRMPVSLRRLLKCKLKLTLGEGLREKG